MRLSKKLQLSERDRKFLGVCGGLGEALEIDPNFVRLVAIPLFFLTGFVPLIITYLAAWVLLPAATRSKQPAHAKTVEGVRVGS